MIAVREDVERALEEWRPNLQRDGGDVELVRIEGGDVFVRLKGHCVGCPISALTLKVGLERTLQRLVPGVERVIAVS